MLKSISQQQRPFQQHPAPVHITNSVVRMAAASAQGIDAMDRMTVETTVMNGTVDPLPQVHGGQHLIPVTVTSFNVGMESVFTAGINVMATITVGTTRMR